MLDAKRQIGSVTHGLLDQSRVILCQFHRCGGRHYIAHRVNVFVDGRAFCELSGEQVNKHGFGGDE
ncbi:hypothetical protein [Agrobacterium tumefaciens]|nr:hypothetical protein FY143_26570 [Agrobacterium tumefaciens]